MPHLPSTEQSPHPRSGATPLGRIPDFQDRRKSNFMHAPPSTTPKLQTICPGRVNEPKSKSPHLRCMRRGPVRRVSQARGPQDGSEAARLPVAPFGEFPPKRGRVQIVPLRFAPRSVRGSYLPAQSNERPSSIGKGEPGACPELLTAAGLPAACKPLAFVFKGRTRACRLREESPRE